MIPYYGSKKRLAKYYPAPDIDTIIEPFAGFDHYSLHRQNWRKQVILIEKYEMVARVWKYLISASKKDIQALPQINPGDDIRNHSQLSQEELWLMGFCLNMGASRPKYSIGPWGNQWENHRRQIINSLHKIKHWQIIHDEYITAPNIKATWFIDPPYQSGGQGYTMSFKKIDSDELKSFCLSRQGQLIVCENSSATWLPFKKLKNHTSGNSRYKNGNMKTTECIFTKNCKSIKQTKLNFK
ncbi:MAG: hypothetical protein ABII98_01225 [bacterium]